MLSDATAKFAVATPMPAVEERISASRRVSPARFVESTMKIPLRWMVLERNHQRRAIPANRRIGLAFVFGKFAGSIYSDKRLERNVSAVSARSLYVRRGGVHRASLKHATRSVEGCTTSDNEISRASKQDCRRMGVHSRTFAASRIRNAFSEELRAGIESNWKELTHGAPRLASAGWDKTRQAHLNIPVPSAAYILNDSTVQQLTIHEPEVTYGTV